MSLCPLRALPQWRPLLASSIEPAPRPHRLSPPGGGIKMLLFWRRRQPCQNLLESLRIVSPSDPTQLEQVEEAFGCEWPVGGFGLVGHAFSGGDVSYDVVDDAAASLGIGFNEDGMMVAGLGHVWVGEGDGFADAEDAVVRVFLR